MYACPDCDNAVQDFELACPRCGADLCVMARLHELPDAQFNGALRAARSGDWATATLLLGAVLSVRFADAEAWALLGTLYARRGLNDLAAECFQTVRMLQPRHPRAQQALDALAAQGARR